MTRQIQDIDRKAQADITKRADDSVVEIFAQVQGVVSALGASGGVIALDPRGTLATPHSTPGLLNGYVTRDGRIVTRVFNDETPTG